MIDLRRVAIIFVIAVLYAIFVNAIIDAVYPSRDMKTFAKEGILLKRLMQWLQ